MPDKARIGVVGAGWWSTTAHLPAIKANPDAELVAVADKRPEALTKAAAAYGDFKPYPDQRAMLSSEQLDGVVVCVNHAAHYEAARDCLDAGVHVMLDKPMVLEAKHARDLQDRARANGVELIVGYPWNYTPLTRRAREIIQSGELGAIQFVSVLFSSMVIEFLRGNDKAYSGAFGYKVTGPGAVYSDPKLSGGGQGHLQVTHSAGALMFITGLRASVVSSFMENYGLAVDLTDAISVRFEAQNGTPVIGTLSSTGNIAVGDSGLLDVQIYCEHGRLALEEIASTLYVRYPDGREERLGPLPPEERYPSHAPANNLIDICLGRGVNGSPADVGVRVVELLDAAYRSAADGGRPVRVADL